MTAVPAFDLHCVHTPCVVAELIQPPAADSLHLVAYTRLVIDTTGAAIAKNMPELSRTMALTETRERQPVLARRNLCGEPIKSWTDAGKCLICGR